MPRSSRRLRASPDSSCTGRRRCAIGRLPRSWRCSPVTASGSRPRRSASRSTRRPRSTRSTSRRFLSSRNWTARPRRKMWLPGARSSRSIRRRMSANGRCQPSRWRRDGRRWRSPRTTPACGRSTCRKGSRPGRSTTFRAAGSGRLRRFGKAIGGIVIMGSWAGTSWSGCRPKRWIFPLSGIPVGTRSRGTSRPASCRPAAGTMAD